MFISSLQNGLTRVIGDPALIAWSCDWQPDVSLTSNYEGFHTKAHFFQAWIQNYATYADESVADPIFTDARLLRWINTPLATLTGFELAGDYDWNEHLTAYGKMSYVQGFDQTVDAPLPSMSPLEGTIKLLAYTMRPTAASGASTLRSARFAAQNLVGAIRIADGSTDTVAVEQATNGFVVCNLRGYYNYSKHLTFVAGIDNLFNENYIEHLDLRVQEAPVTPNVPPANNFTGQEFFVYQPGISVPTLALVGRSKPT